jgi:integrase
MGAVYRPKYKAADGTVRVAAVWWVRFRQHGKTIRQSTETTSHAKAMEFLRQQEGKVALKIPVDAQAERLTLAEGAEMIRKDYLTNGRKSADTLEYRLRHVLRHFDPLTRLSRLTTAAIEAYKAARLEAGAKPATINRELACLSRVATLARLQHNLVTRFVVTGLEERNVRKGFFEDDQHTGVQRLLPERLRAITAVARITGWRKTELKSRQWSHVDFKAGWLRMEPEETKNREGRMFPLIPEVRAILEVQKARAEAIQREQGKIVPWVFFKDKGDQLGDFKKAWTTARRKAGIPGRIFHDYRRTAARNLIRAGVPETVAMKMTGHLTNSVFKRYAIVDEAMLNEAGAKLVAAMMTQRDSKAKRKSAKMAVRRS